MTQVARVCLRVCGVTSRMPTFLHILAQPRNSWSLDSLTTLPRLSCLQISSIAFCPQASCCKAISLGSFIKPDRGIFIHLVACHHMKSPHRISSSALVRCRGRGRGTAACPEPATRPSRAYSMPLPRLGYPANQHFLPSICLHVACEPWCAAQTAGADGRHS